MYAIVENGTIVKTAGSVRALFPNVSIPSNLTSNWAQNNNVQEIVHGERKDERFYWVTPGELTVINGQPTQTYVNTPKELEDREEVDKQGNPLYVQVYDPTANDGQGGMVNSSQKLISKGLKSQWIAVVKEIANKDLAPTDWYVIRKLERNIDIPIEISSKRDEIITKANQKEIAISSATTIEELMAAVL